MHEHIVQMDSLSFSEEAEKIINRFSRIRLLDEPCTCLLTLNVIEETYIRFIFKTDRNGVILSFHLQKGVL